MYTNMCGGSCEACELDVRICKSAAGYYIGIWDEDGPYCRASTSYYATRAEAAMALLRFGT